mgnify:CR=1 FL=1
MPPAYGCSPPASNTRSGPINICSPEGLYDEHPFAMVVPMITTPQPVPFALTHPFPAYPVGARPARPGRTSRSARPLRAAASAPAGRRVARRRGVLAAAVLVLSVGVVALRAGSAEAGEATRERVAAPRFVIARTGDTLWSIAMRLAPATDTTELVDRLVALNGDTVHAGQAVLLP